MYKIFILFLFYIPALSFAQINDDFSDGDFSTNPVWIGNTGSFSINAGYQLQLDTHGSGVKFLATKNTLIQNIEWNFWLKLDFDPSSNNQLRIYLTSDEKDLTKPLNGYFIKVGENLARDGIDLYRQEGSDETLIIDGMDAHAAKKPELRIKVLHKTNGNWELYSDTLGSKNFALEGISLDTTIKTTSFFGVHCKFTSSNAHNFFFDDFYVGAEQVDTIGPKLVNANFLTRSKFQIQFDEDILQDSIDQSDFTIISLTSPDYTYHAISQVRMINSKTVHIDISPEYFIPHTQIIYYFKVFDLLGNYTTAGGFGNFSGLNSKDVIINEIMSDPSPANTLPETEFIELFNTTNNTIYLKDFIISDPSKQAIFPDFNLQPDKYVILCDVNDTSLFIPYGDVVGISLPSLNNASDIIILKDKYGSLVDSISYSDTWYKEDEKKEGGWSLELINPTENCLFDEYNWLASEDKTGGTPGQLNSVYDPSYGFDPPQIHSLIIISDSIIQITSNKKLRNVDDISFSLLHIQSSTHPKENISLVTKRQPQPNIYELSCNKPLETNSIYQIQIDSFMDCNNMYREIDTQLVIPVQADSANLLINEILFNPYPNGFDFVEIYNRSNKIIDLQNISIVSFNDSMQMKSAYPISTHAKILYPEEYIVITENPADIEARYLCKFPERLFETKLPSYADDEGIVALIDQNNNLIDLFHYTEQMHFALLDEEEGVSLERINFDEKTNNPSNWHSAASSYGYATPTYQNSQFSEINPAEKELWLDPKVFSPNGDGYHDLLIIHYAFRSANNFGRIRIFDIAGRLVKELVNNGLFGMEGFYIWDGIDNTGEISPSGVYIVVAEINNLNGNTNKYKRSCTLVKGH